MKTLFIKINPYSIEEEKIDLAVDIILKGGLVIVPTETVYGIACDSQNKEAVEKLTKLKGNRENKPFSYNLAKLDWIDRYFSVSDESQRVLKAFKNLFPGPITIVVKLKDGDKIGIRIPENEIIQKIIVKCEKPLYIPSANPTDDLPAVSAEEAIFYFWDKVDLIIDGGNTRYGVSSLVLDLSSPSLKILRNGPPYIESEIKKRIENFNVLKESEV
jgi:L-threonylcarbamoyladenylate synthase